MYIQITTRCNMECAHCAYSCTAKGENMSIRTFKQCLALGDEMLAIGGGEPTVHPKFWELLGLALGHCEYVWLATNGKKTNMALRLARLAKRGVVGVDLSLDKWHEPISSMVVEAYTIKKRRGPYAPEHQPHDLRAIRNVGSPGEPINAGRCNWGRDDCSCPDLFVIPNGTVYGCGCKDSPRFGHVNSDVDIPEDWEHDKCYKNQGLLTGTVVERTT